MNKPFTVLAFLLGGVLVYKLVVNRTGSANKSTVSLDNSKAQAATFFDLFGVVREGAFAVATPVVLTSTKNKIAWLAMNIDDWQVVQSTFSALCGGGYTILQAASTALNADNNAAFLAYIRDAQKKKRIFCKDKPSYSVRFSSNVEIVGENFNKDAFVGRLQKEDSGYYYYISSRDGLAYACDKNNFKTV